MKASIFNLLDICADEFGKHSWANLQNMCRCEQSTPCTGVAPKGMNSYINSRLTQLKLQ